MLVTIIFWPMVFSITAASWRFMTSVPPPADEKTTLVMVFFGNSWPRVDIGTSSAATAQATTIHRARFFMASPPRDGVRLALRCSGSLYQAATQVIESPRRVVFGYEPVDG